MHDKEIKMNHLRDALPGTEDTESPPILTGKPASLDAIKKSSSRTDWAEHKNKDVQQVQ